MISNKVLSGGAENSLHRLTELEILTKSASSIAPENLVMSVAAEVETYSDRLLEELIVSSIVSKNDFGQLLIKTIGHQFYQSWPERKKWLKCFKVWVDPDCDKKLVTLVDFRNSVAHGDGKLTKLQTRDFAKRMALESDLESLLDVFVDGAITHAGTETMKRILDIARDYIVKLDEKSRDLYPGVVF